jgi:lycopene beta-cyclase
MRAGIFHDTTGYSLPDAIRVVSAIADLDGLSPDSVRRTLAKYRRAQAGQRALLRMLNRMLFLAAEPAERYRILEHFYRLPEDLVSRFYAARLGPLDVARIFLARPPVRVSRAIASLLQDPGTRS